MAAKTQAAPVSPTLAPSSSSKEAKAYWQTGH